MRDGIKPASLGELMGKGFEHRDKLTLADLPKLLGEKMPHLPYDRVGRIRLVNALHQRFGPGFKNVPGIADILSEFDKEMHVASTVKMNHHANKMRQAMRDSEATKVQKFQEGGTAKPADDDVIDHVLATLKDQFVAPDKSYRVKKAPASPTAQQASDMSKTFGKTKPTFAGGGKIPGKAPMPGDHPANDKVRAMLSPGEIVIPRSITMHPDAPQLAAKFVANELKKKRG